MRSAACGVLFLSIGCATAPTTTAETAKPVETASAAPATGSMALHVKGMGCPLCATNVRKSLERTPGVDAVNIDLGAGVVKVSARPNLAPEETALRKAVADAGFECSKIERL
jgi:copper chaperone CopZ